MIRRRPVVALIIAALCLPHLARGAVTGKQVMYVGGTVGVPEATEGVLETSNPKALIFRSPRGEFEIPYNGITSVEYGQKAGRRVGVAIVISVWALFSKKRKHFLTVGYTDRDDVSHGVVIELPKGTPKSIITIIEARSGVKCEYESEEARKHVHG